MIVTPFVQDADELAELLRRLKQSPPSRVLEIGTYLGGTLKEFCNVATEEALIISVDLPGGDYGGGYGEEMMPIYKLLAKPRQRLELIRDDSHKPETLAKVTEILGMDELDFLFIDGDHTYRGVKADWEMYSPLVRKGGLVAFHDITKQTKYGVQVYEFWQILKKGQMTEEIIRDPSQMGIGLVHK